MIQPSKAGSHGGHGVAKPQPDQGCSAVRSSTAAQMVSRPVRSALRPSAEKIVSRSSQSAVSAAEADQRVADVVPRALAGSARAAHEQHGHQHRSDHAAAAM